MGAGGARLVVIELFDGCLMGDFAYGGAHLKGVVLHFCPQIGRPVTGMWQGYAFDK